MDPADRDMLILAAVGLAAAGLVLFFLRRSLATKGHSFWLGMGAGLGVLMISIMAVAVWAVEATESEFAGCRATPSAPQCADAGMLLAMVGVASLISVIVFLIGGVVMRVTARKP